MNLVLDIGNTYIKSGVFSGGILISHHIFSTAEASGSGQIIKRLLSETPKESLVSVIVSSVAGVPSFWQESIEHLFVLDLNHTTPLPFLNVYETPETLGYDRIAAVAGALCTFPGEDILVIDAGTCITYDFVSRLGVYQGGAISPGIQMRYKALHTMTGRLPLLEKTTSAALTGKTTSASIHSGVINGVLAEVNAIMAAYREAYPKIKIILTGGDINFFDKKLKIDIFASPFLVLIGLNNILEFNAQKI